MGQVIDLSTVERKPVKRSDVTVRHKENTDTENGAQILFFTGVRYERSGSLPSERLSELTKKGC